MFVVRSVFLTMGAFGLVLGGVIASLVSMPFLVENPELQSDEPLAFRVVRIFGLVLFLALPSMLSVEL